jgi:hypothetical protein
MDIRTIASAGYNFWTDVVTVSICEPEVGSIEIGAVNVNVESLEVSLSAKYSVPSMRVSSDSS